MRQIFPLWLAFMMASSVVATEAEKSLADYPEMAPERCAKLPLTEMYDRLMAAESHPPGISSEAGHDYFCAVYQQQLQQFVDAKYPEARQYRKVITDAFLETVHYVEEIYSFNMIKHLYERTSADAEWAIYQAEKDNYRPWRETNYGAADIERIALVMADGSGGGMNFESEALPHLHEAMRKFAQATTDEHGESIRRRRRYLAHALIKFLTGLI